MDWSKLYCMDSLDSYRKSSYFQYKRWLTHITRVIRITPCILTQWSELPQAKWYRWSELPQVYFVKFSHVQQWCQSRRHSARTVDSFIEILSGPIEEISGYKMIYKLVWWILTISAKEHGEIWVQLISLEWSELPRVNSLSDLSSTKWGNSDQVESALSISADTFFWPFVFWWFFRQ